MKLLLLFLMFTYINVSAQSKNKMIRISEIEIDSNYLKEYYAILQEEARASVQLEAGVIAIYPMYQKENPTQVRILEIYASREAYEAHLKTPHFQKYKTSTLKMVKSLKLVDMDNIDSSTMAEIFRKMSNDDEKKHTPIQLGNTEQEVINLSKKKWLWMSDKNVDSLNPLFHDKSMFIHMGGSWGKKQEIDVIKSGNIWYKKAEVYSASVNIIGNTAILLNDIDLVAVVGGNEVINPFMVTEVYIKEKDKWEMGSLTFSRLTRPVKLNSNNNSSPSTNQLIIQQQGSFAVGGTVITNPGVFDPIQDGAFNPANQSSQGQSLHGDHASVFYQIPNQARKFPLVFWHGHGQSARTWQTTPDGREGFQNIFLRQRFPVYLVDQPRRGQAARSTKPINITATPDEQLWFGIFRLGAYPNFYPEVQFSKDSNTLNQFYRQMVPNTGPYDAQVSIDAVSSLFDKIGQGILVTHSQSGGPGWRTAIKNSNVKAVVAFEPGGDFVFPEGEALDTIKVSGRTITPPKLPMADFMKLTKIPIIIYYGDNIPDQPSTNPGQEQWRVFLSIAKQFRDVVNKHGGDVTLVHLPAIGIKGNTHFPMSDLNSLEIANHLTEFLKKKNLD